MIIQPITKAKYIINIVKSVGKDIDYALDIVAWYTMTDGEEEQVKQSIINNWHTQLFNIYLGIIKNIKYMNQEKISRAVKLQNRANDEIETYGEASDSTVNELMDIVDNMTPEEGNEFVAQYMVVQWSK